MLTKRGRLVLLTVAVALAGAAASAPTRWRPAAAATTVYEARVGHAVRRGRRRYRPRGFLGSGFVDGYVDANRGTAATTFGVTVSAAAVYQLTLRYANGTGATRSLSIYLNGSRVKQTSLAATADWNTWGSQVESVSMPAGADTISYRFDAADTGNVNLDQLSVDGGPAPASVYEAELAALTGGIAAATDHSGYLGSGFVGGYVDTNRGTAATTFSVAVPSAAVFKVTLRYANGTGSTVRSGTKLRSLPASTRTSTARELGSRPSTTTSTRSSTSRVQLLRRGRCGQGRFRHPGCHQAVARGDRAGRPGGDHDPEPQTRTTTLRRRNSPPSTWATSCPVSTSPTTHCCRAACSLTWTPRFNRFGSANFHQLPVNQSHSAVNNYQQDSSMRYANRPGNINYEPNSLGGDAMEAPVSAPAGSFSYPEVVQGPKIRARSGTFSDHFTQATLFYRSLTAPEQQHVINALQFELGKVSVVAVKQRMLGLLANVDGRLVHGSRRSLGLPTPRGHVATSVRPSPALSEENTPKSAATRKVAILTADGVHRLRCHRSAAQAHRRRRSQFHHRAARGHHHQQHRPQTGRRFQYSDLGVGAVRRGLHPGRQSRSCHP